MLSLLNKTPDVSSAVLTPFSESFLNNSVTNSICAIGSPPVTVTPPAQNSLTPSYCLTISSTLTL